MEAVRAEAPSEGVPPEKEGDPRRWSNGDVLAWAARLDLGEDTEHVLSAFRTNHLTGVDLLELDKEALKQDLGITVMHSWKELLRQIEVIKLSTACAEPQPEPEPEPQPAAEPADAALGFGAGKKFHAFLTHDWGRDGSGRDNHGRVSRVNDLLKRKGIRTWFDEERISGDIVEAMTKGIDDSSTVVVFITKKYHDKVNGDNKGDNCKKEFMYAERRKTSAFMIPVVMEEASGNHAAMRAPTGWTGPLGMALGGELYVDLAGDAEAPEFAAKVDELVEKIRGLTDHETNKIADRMADRIADRVSDRIVRRASIELCGAVADRIAAEASTAVQGAQPFGMSCVVCSCRVIC